EVSVHRSRAGVVQNPTATVSEQCPGPEGWQQCQRHRGSVESGSRHCLATVATGSPITDQSLCVLLINMPFDISNSYCLQVFSLYRSHHSITIVRPSHILLIVAGAEGRYRTQTQLLQNHSPHPRNQTSRLPRVKSWVYWPKRILLQPLLAWQI